MEDFFHMIVAVLLFLSALGMCFAGVYRLTKTMSSLPFSIEDEVAFTSNLKAETDYCEVSQLAATLLCDAEFAIQVVFSDGTSMRIPAAGVDIEAVQRVCQADAAGYSKTYDYDEQGTIKGLTFTQIRRE